MVDALAGAVVELVGHLQDWGGAIRDADGYYPSSPQEAILHPDVQVWMTDHGRRTFGGVPT
jgi:hypothetical protein